MKKTLLSLFLMVISMALIDAQIFITELADPNNDASARYVELYNAGTAPVDLSTGYKIQRYTNGNVAPQDSVPLTGVIPAGGFYLIVNNSSNFVAVYGIQPDQDVGTGGPGDSNGDDNIQILDPSNDVIDIFGVPGEDGSNTAHEFEDGRAERMDTVTVGKATWDAGEWNVWNDNTSGDERTAPDDFDPGYWGGDNLNAEPDNHVTSFTATALDFSSVKVSWTDAVGTNGAFGYIVKASSVSYNDITAPVDGTPLADDATTINVKPGVQEATFTGLSDNTTYYFKIAPYSNYSTDINYKTDGTVPEAEATTPMAGDFILTEDFETSLSWEAISDTGDQVWEHYTSEGANGTGSSARINGYSSGNKYNVDWLIAPPVNLDAYTGEVLNFYTEWQYGAQNADNYLKLLYSTDYNGNGTPQAATWSELSFTSGGSNVWAKTDDIDISVINAPTVYFAFKYKSLDNSRRWNVDEVIALGTYAGDATAPIFNTSSPATDDVRENQFDIVMNLNEVGTVFYLVQNDGDPAPDIATVRSADTMDIITANADFSTTIDTVSMATTYDIYFIAIDTSGNQQAALTQIDVTTRGPRELEFTFPLGGETFYMGDSVTITWTSSNIDSVILYVETFHGWGWEPINEDLSKLDASTGEFPLLIPLNADADSVKMLITDAEDFSFGDSSGVFYLIDTIDPEIEMMIPENKSENISTLPKLELYFNEQIGSGTGNITIHKSDGSLIETIDVTSNQVATDRSDNYGPVAYIQTSVRLENETAYYVLMDKGTFIDSQGNGSQGIISDTVWTFTTMSTDIFFSEYIEGGSYNKALEIYNATGSDVDLANYQIWRATNGENWVDASPSQLGGILKADSVFVICHTDASDEIKARSDSIGGILNDAVNFNGNDPVGLFKQVGMDWILIDAIGEAGMFVEFGYDVAGVSEATKDHTLLRKDFIMAGNINWDASAGTNGFDSEWKIMDKDYYENLGELSPKSDSLADIKSFVLNEQYSEAVIDSAAATVDIVVALDTKLDSLFPVITVSEGAMIEPASGDSVDFSGGPVVFTVTAENLTNVREWTVTVTESLILSSEKKILSFVLEDETKDAVIDNVNFTVTAEVEYGTALTALAPVITVSAAATIDPLSGVAQDFSGGAVNYTVTAQDATTQVWAVTVAAVAPIEVADLAALRAGMADDKTLYKVTGEAVLTFQQDYYHQKIVQDATAGILIHDADGIITTTYSLGDGITGITGTLHDYFGMLELYPIADPGDASSSGNTVDAQTITVSEFTSNFENYENELIRIDSVDFADGGGTFANNSNYVISRDDASSVLRVHFFESGVDGTAIPAKANVTGIATWHFSEAKVAPISASGIEEVIISNINDLWAEDMLKIYPNPSSGMITLELTNDAAADLELEIYSLNGKMVYRNSLRSVTNIQENIDLSDLGRGLYMLRVRSENQVSMRKLVIQ